MECPSPETLHTCLNTFLCDLFLVALPWKALDWIISRGPFQSDSGTLEFCQRISLQLLKGQFALPKLRKGSRANQTVAGVGNQSLHPLFILGAPQILVGSSLTCGHLLALCAVHTEPWPGGSRHAPPRDFKEASFVCCMFVPLPSVWLF